ncbi:ABC transporter substrate-binding protein [Labrys okinawensis]|uniref:ABC transporter substrate-binding protein n=1 Tax=Labrys okinawensis TaxID=346911 RepID=UPI0039BD1417
MVDQLSSEGSEVKTNWIASIGIALVAALSPYHSATAQTATSDAVEEIVKRGELIVAVQTQGPPVSFVNKNGERVGFVIDMLKLMAADMGVKLVMKDYDFRGLIPAAVSGKVDFVAADMAPTPQRALQMTFTDTFYEEPAILYAKTSKGFQKAVELNKAGLRIGVAQGSSNKQILQHQFPNASIVELAGAGPALAQAADSDRVDAVINVRSAARSNLLSYGDTFKILEGDLYQWPEAFAVTPEKTHLIAWINNWLYWAKRDGKIEKWADYWRRSDDWRKDNL